MDKGSRIFDKMFSCFQNRLFSDVETLIKFRVIVGKGWKKFLHFQFYHLKIF